MKGTWNCTISKRLLGKKKIFGILEVTDFVEEKRNRRKETLLSYERRKTYYFPKS